jgi:hypothetical protein
VSRVPVFHGRVSPDGKLVLEEAESGLRKEYLRGLAEKPVDITIKVHRSKRSLDQNKWLWGVAIPLVADALGYDLDEHERLHYALIDLCFGTMWDTRLGIELPKVRSSQMNTKEFSDYMEWLVRWAARDHGIVIPLPSESEAA